MKKKTWFELAGARDHGTRSGAGPLNIRVEKGRLRSEETSSATESSRHGIESHMR
jgi:hypothetical protein